MNQKIIVTAIFGLLFLQVIQNDLRLMSKAYNGFTSKETDFISELEEVFTESQDLTEPHSKFYFDHQGNPDLIKNYFASQYRLVPKLISDKPQDSSLPRLNFVRADDSKLMLSITESE